MGLQRIPVRKTIAHLFAYTAQTMCTNYALRTGHLAQFQVFCQVHVSNITF